MILQERSPRFAGPLAFFLLIPREAMWIEKAGIHDEVCQECLRLRLNLD